MKPFWERILCYSRRALPPQRMPAIGGLWASEPRVWRRLGVAERKFLLELVAQSEARRLATCGPFRNSFDRLVFLKRCLGGHVTVHLHGRSHMARLGARGLRLRGARAGGRATLLLHGREHFRMIGRLGAIARWGEGEPDR